ncbi:MAG TPA: AI-2E family transporter [Thermoanaerobaculia bacterium]
MKQQVTEESWRKAWRSPLRFSAIFIGAGVLLLFLWISRPIFIASFLGLLFGVSIMPAVAWLHRFHVPRGLGAALLVAAFFASLAGIASLLAPVLQEQAQELERRLPEAIDRIDRELLKRHILTNALEGGEPPPAAVRVAAARTAAQRAVQAQTAAEAATLRRSPLRVILGQQLGGVIPYLFPVFSTTIAAVTGLILVVFLTIFFAADPETYTQGVLHLLPHAHRARMTEVLETMGRSLRAWLVARSIAMVTIGVVVTALMALLRVRASVALGVIAGLLEFVPVFGPILGAIPAIALGLVDSPQKAVAVLIAFVVIQQLEGNVLIPLLLQKAVEVPPALSLIGIASLGMVLGVLGVVIAEPLVAVTLVAVKMLYVEPVVGDKMAPDETV